MPPGASRDAYIRLGGSAHKYCRRTQRLTVSRQPDVEKSRFDHNISLCILLCRHVFIAEQGIVPLVHGPIGSAPVLTMADRDKGSNERRGLASADEETKKRVARAGGEASHGGRGGSSSSKGSHEGGSSGSRSSTSGGSHGGSSGSSSRGGEHDTSADPCRDEHGRFTECDDDDKGRSSGGSKSSSSTGSKGASSSGSSGSSSSGSKSGSSSSRSRD